MEPLGVLQLVVSKLEGIGIPYMVGGSFASSLHGEPRATKDVDLVIDIRGDQVKAFVESLGLEFYLNEGQIRDALRGTRAFNIIHLESSFKVDLFVLGGRGFDREEFSRRRLQVIEGKPRVHIYVKTAEDILLSKLQWYRSGGGRSTTQWRDAIGVLRAQAGRLDLAYLGHWATELGVADLLNRALTEAQAAEEQMGRN